MFFFNDQMWWILCISLSRLISGIFSKFTRSPSGLVLGQWIRSFVETFGVFQCHLIRPTQTTTVLWMTACPCFQRITCTVMWWRRRRGTPFIFITCVCVCVFDLYGDDNEWMVMSLVRKCAEEVFVLSLSLSLSLTHTKHQHHFHQNRSHDLKENFTSKHHISPEHMLTPQESPWETGQDTD